SVKQVYPDRASPHPCHRASRTGRTPVTHATAPCPRRHWCRWNRQKASCRVGGLFDVPAQAQTERQSPRGYLIEAGHRLRRLDRVSLRQKKNSRPNQEFGCRESGRCQRDESIVGPVELARKLAARWVRRGLACGNV